MMLLTAISIRAEVYRCEFAGGVVYQDLPCPKPDNSGFSVQKKSPSYIQQESNNYPKTNSYKSKKSNNGKKTCSLWVLKTGLNDVLDDGERQRILCEEATGVTKDKIIKVLPGAVELEVKSGKNMKFLQWKATNGQRYKMVVYAGDNLVHRAVMYRK